MSKHVAGQQDTANHGVSLEFTALSCLPTRAIHDHTVKTQMGFQYNIIASSVSRLGSNVIAVFISKVWCFEYGQEMNMFKLTFGVPRSMQAFI